MATLWGLVNLALFMGAPFFFLLKKRAWKTYLAVFLIALSLFYVTKDSAYLFLRVRGVVPLAAAIAYASAWALLSCIPWRGLRVLSAVLRALFHAVAFLVGMFLIWVLGDYWSPLLDLGKSHGFTVTAQRWGWAGSDGMDVYVLQPTSVPGVDKITGMRRYRNCISMSMTSLPDSRAELMCMDSGARRDTIMIHMPESWARSYDTGE